MRLIKCTTSFVIGFYLAFVMTLAMTGYVIVKGFVSKALLERKSFYMDGHIYEIKKR